MSPQIAEKSRALIEKRKFRFEILRDSGNAVASSYGLRWAFPDDLKKLYLGFGIDLEEGNGDGSWTLPIPARYIIDRDGLIRYARFDPDYTRRPEPRETLDALVKV